ncbi:MAG: 1,4-alpha-glucan branching protein GlgB [Saprospiraceae bacterium]|nr:1,4-alpha-glucan branching protein GlgB [Saprospiraceae bacterium]
MQNNILSHSLLTDFDIELFKSGKHFKLYEKMGAHLIEVDGVKGCYFAVWAPAAERVSVIGNFNEWTEEGHDLHVRWDGSGIWEGFLPGIERGEIYKYRIYSKHNGQILTKADPFARYTEKPPRTASVIWDEEFNWSDQQWMKKRKKHNSLEAPFNVYEVHLGSWKKNLDPYRPLTYGEMAIEMVDYVKEMGFSHVELMPVMEHPYEPSWGYQGTSYFAPTSRFGEPGDLKYLIDSFHNAGIGVILDWVPAHFPADAWALANFDGTCVYEHPDRRKGFHPDWKSLIFNFERNEVRSFLISSALFWLDRFHIDGLRVDAVASMIYLDYSRNEGEWEANEYGGNENLAAISFLQEFNSAVYHHFPDTQTIAEESTSYANVTKPVHDGGLGFGMKWMMGWMNDTLDYFSMDPIYRKFHHGKLSFSLVYAFSENFMLPLSHDEVVHLKCSLVNKMPGDQWQQFANLRLLYSYMYGHPGAKLLFMGGEIGQYSEWNHEREINWHLLSHEPNAGVQALVKDLNTLYKKEKAFTELSFHHSGFEWVAHDDADNSIIAFLRKGKKEKDTILVVLNFTPNAHPKYELGVPESKSWKLIFNSDDDKYWGSGYKVKKTIKTRKKEKHGRKGSIELAIVPMGSVMYKMS